MGLGKGLFFSASLYLVPFGRFIFSSFSLLASLRTKLMGREGEDDDEAIDEKAPVSYLSIAAEARRINRV